MQMYLVFEGIHSNVYKQSQSLYRQTERQTDRYIDALTYTCHFKTAGERDSH